MSIAVESISTPVWTMGSSIIETKPASTTSGDLLIVHINTRNDGGGTGGNSVTPPSGWTLIKFVKIVGNNVYDTSQAYYKVAGGSEPSSYTFTLDGSMYYASAIYRITGADTVTPIPVNNGTAVVNTNSPSFAAGITPTVADSLIMILLGATSITTANVGTFALTTDTISFTKAYDVNSTAPTEVGASLIGAYGVRTPTTATGNFSCIGGNGATDWAGIILAVSPGASEATNSNFLMFM